MEDKEDLKRFYKKEASISKRRAGSLYKEKGIPTCIFSQAETEEWVKGGLHKYRYTWHPIFEPRIATDCCEEVLEEFLAGKIKISFLRETWSKKVEERNKAYFKKHNLSIKSFVPTRAQRAVFGGFIRWIKSEYLNAN